MTVRTQTVCCQWLIAFGLCFVAFSTSHAQGWLPWKWPERSVQEEPQKLRYQPRSAPSKRYTSHTFYQPKSLEERQASNALKHGAYYRALEIYHQMHLTGSEVGRLGMAVTLARLNRNEEAKRLLTLPWNDKKLADTATAYLEELTKKAPLTEPPAQIEEGLPFYRVGLLLPLSGKLAPFGNDLRAAAELALFHSNNTQIVLYPEDAGLTAESAEEAVQRLLRLGVDAIVGPLLGNQVDAVAPFARSANVPLLSFSNDIRVAGKGAYPLGNPPQQQLEAAINAAYQQGQKSFAALVPATDDGSAMVGTITSAVAASGASLTRITTYPQNANDITDALKQLLQVNEAAKQIEEERELLEADYVLLGGAMADEDLARLEELRKAEATALIDFDALLLPVPPSRIPLLLAQLAFYDVNPQNVPIYSLSSVAELSGSGRDLYGVLYPDPIQATKTFPKRFTKAYGRSATGPAILGYAAIETLNQALISAQGKPKDVKVELLEHNFGTVAGSWRFAPSGHVLRSYSLKRLKRIPETVLQAPANQPPAIPGVLLDEEQPSTLFDENGWN
jgi:ABC-type branched-subunit amino acid transport system substrate-binding protein